MLAGLALDGQSLRTDDGVVVHGQADVPLPVGRRAVATFWSESLSVHVLEPTGSPRNHCAGAVTAFEPQAHLMQLRMGEIAAEITPDSVTRLDSVPGTQAMLSVKAAEVRLYEG